LDVAILFASILIHELAHAIVARRFAVPIGAIAVHYLGGVVQFLGRPRRRNEDCLITLAGPLSNFVLAGIAFGVLLLIPAGEPHPVAIGDQVIQRPPSPGLLGRALPFAIYINLGLAIINMLPGFPLDGGRLMYLLVEKYRDPRLATLVVGSLGMVFGALSLVLLLMTALAGFP